MLVTVTVVIPVMVLAGCGSGARAEVVSHASPSPSTSGPASTTGSGGGPTDASVKTAAAGVTTGIDGSTGGVLVDVSGAVHRAGVYRLAPGARVLDAIAAAGGATRVAQLAALNRAATITDGQQVVVPDVQVAAAAGAAAGGTGALGTQVSLATGTVADFDALPGIGPVTAAKIVADRTANGAFGSVDELDRVPGIGPVMVEQLRELVTT